MLCVERLGELDKITKCPNSRSTFLKFKSCDLNCLSSRILFLVTHHWVLCSCFLFKGIVICVHQWLTLPYDWGTGVKVSALGSDREGAHHTSMSTGVAMQTQLQLLRLGLGLVSLTNMPCKMLVFSIFGHCALWFFGVMQKWSQEYLGMKFHVLEACLRFFLLWLTWV